MTNTHELLKNIKELLDCKIIFHNNSENNMLIFLTKNYKNIELKKDELQIKGKSMYIQKYDPIENYLVQCPNCHMLNHTYCDEEKRCAKCQKTNCKGICKKEDAKCINCKKNHSAYYKGCKVYQEHLNNAYTERKQKYQNIKINKIQNAITLTSKSTKDNHKTYAEITKQIKDDNLRKKSPA